MFSSRCSTGILSEKIRAAEADAELTEGQPAPSLDAPIRFEAVTFAYDDRPVLDALSAVIRPNTLTVVFGPSGSGKSTFIDLLLGLAKPSGGRILVGDVPLNDIDLRSWRAQIGFVPQEVLLFNDTLLSNITLDDPALSRADVEASLKEAGAWSFVSALPRGLDTEVGERGSMLSGGQRQRIALARALVRRPSLLILDEATSALDPEIERAIWEELKVLTRRHTIVAVTHQPRVLGLADAVLGLENGRAIATPFPRRAVRFEGMNGTFSPHGYCELVSAFCVQGYRVVGFDAIDPTARHLVLRHDVDMSLDHARRTGTTRSGARLDGNLFRSSRL